MATATASSPHAFRRRVRQGLHTNPFTTAGCCPGYVQANLVVLPQAYAYDFMTFCVRNFKPCPLLDVCDVGDPCPPAWLAKDADLRTDVPLYRVWKDGELLEEVEDILAYWQPDSVAFLLGCSFSFEEALERAGLPPRHVEEKKNVPMYKTNIPCRPAGRFHGTMVVSMRPYLPEQVDRVIQVTSRYEKVHGAPVHTGDPAAIGILDLGTPDYGDAVTVAADKDVPCFFACGVTPQNAILTSKPPGIVITHAPGAMFVSDVLNESLTSLS